MRIVFAGTPDLAVVSLDALLASRHEVAAVLSRPDAPRGRGRRLTASPVAARAAELGIETLKPPSPRDEGFVARLTELAPDCCPVVAYGALLTQRLLDIPRRGWVNLHFSRLPRWRGAAPVQRAILAGDETTGATTFQIVLELDAGPVFGTVSEPIHATDTSGDLLGRLATIGAALLVRTLDEIEAGGRPVEQHGDGLTYASKINASDAEIDWHQTAAEVDRLVRAAAPAPGAWTTFRGERFKVGSGTPDPRTDLAPGQLEVTKRALRVGTAEGSLVLGEVAAQGKKPMPAPDWARGVTFADGDGFGG